MDNNLKVSFQIAVPSRTTSSDSSSGGSSDSPDTVIDSIDCPSLEYAISLANGYISKKINLSHCKVVVISEEVASRGISDIVYTLNNNPEIRPSSNVIISRSTAYDFLANSKSSLENITAKYYEIVTTSSQTTGYTSDITLADVASGLSDTFGEATAILGSVASEKSENSNIRSETDTIAGESTSESGEQNESSSNIDVVGLAVFKGDILVGELTAEETVCHLIITNKLNECIFSIPSPFDEDKSIDLSISLREKTKNRVKLVNGSPYICVDICLNANLLSLNKHTNNFDKDDIELIESYSDSYIKEHINNYLYKTSKDFKSDIAMFGKYAVSKFTTWDKWTKYDWLDNYKNSFFDVNVDTYIASSYLIS